MCVCICVCVCVCVWTAFSHVCMYCVYCMYVLYVMYVCIVCNACMCIYIYVYVCTCVGVYLWTTCSHLLGWGGGEGGGEWYQRLARQYSTPNGTGLPLWSAPHPQSCRPRSPAALGQNSAYSADPCRPGMRVGLQCCRRHALDEALRRDETVRPCPPLPFSFIKSKGG